VNAVQQFNGLDIVSQDAREVLERLDQSIVVRIALGLALDRLA
jgi:hypothetical protein